MVETTSVVRSIPRTEREGVEAFFVYARTRETIRRLREEGRKRELWTRDPVLTEYRFCNIFREDDKTTAWFRENIRDVVDKEGDPKKIILAVAGFRWFTLIRTGEKIKDVLIKHGWRSDLIKQRLRDHEPPLVTGAYMMTSPFGFNKLDGICHAMDILKNSDELKAWVNPQSCQLSLESAHNLLLEVDWLGDFRSYEIVTDLRHTRVLRDAPDIMEWANPGPGALRGTGWVKAEKPNGTRDFRESALRLMRDLTRLANEEDAGMWPASWPRWEMREAEHTLCEFDKYMRGTFTGGRLKRKFRHEA